MGEGRGGQRRAAAGHHRAMPIPPGAVGRLKSGRTARARIGPGAGSRRTVARARRRGPSRQPWVTRGARRRRGGARVRSRAAWCAGGAAENARIRPRRRGQRNEGDVGRRTALFSRSPRSTTRLGEFFGRRGAGGSTTSQGTARKTLLVLAAFCRRSARVGFFSVVVFACRDEDLVPCPSRIARASRLPPPRVPPAPRRTHSRRGEAADGVPALATARGARHGRTRLTRGEGDGEFRRRRGARARRAGRDIVGADPQRVGVDVVRLAVDPRGGTSTISPARRRVL